MRKSFVNIVGVKLWNNDDYYYSSNNTTKCTNSEHKSWLVSGQLFWTRSASSSSSIGVWDVDGVGNLTSGHYSNGNGIRPVITLSTDAL